MVPANRTFTARPRDVVVEEAAQTILEGAPMAGTRCPGRVLEAHQMVAPL